MKIISPRIVGIVLMSIFASILAGCVGVSSQNIYQPPAVDTAPDSTGLPTIQGYHDGTDGNLFNCHWRNAKVAGIDGKKVSYNFWALNPNDWYEQKIPITSGPHLFMIETNFVLACATPPYISMGFIKFTAKPGQQYQLKGKLNGANNDAWVEDANGKRVSEISQAPFTQMPIHDTVVSPIYIPKH